MKTVTEFHCKMSLLREGVPLDLVQKWYNAVYLNPDLSTVDTIIAERILRIPDSDIMDLLTLYGEDGSMAMLRAAIRYLEELFEVSRELPIIEGRGMGNTTAQCIAGFIGRELADLHFVINADACDRLDGAALLITITHEVWHARQFCKVGTWLSDLCGTRINFDIGPERTRREMLYYLNQQYVVQEEESLTGYESQVVEREAYYADEAMKERLRR